MIRINEIVAMKKGPLAIIFTDERSGQRDVTFFKDIATEQDISELEAYTPKPTDAVVTLTLEEDTLQRMQAWADKHGVTVEQMARAFLVYAVRYELEVWAWDGTTGLE